MVGAVGGGLKFKEAQMSMLLADARSGGRVSAAEGSTRKTDLQLGGLLFRGGVGAAAGGYGNTNEGKIIAAAFLDNYNKVATVVRGDPSLQRNVGTLKQEAAAGRATKAGPVFNESDVVVPKIANVRLLAQPADSSKVLATLGKGEELIVIGERTVMSTSRARRRAGGSRRFSSRNDRPRVPTHRSGAQPLRVRLCEIRVRKIRPLGGY
jgi:hypothetical protein